MPDMAYASHASPLALKLQEAWLQTQLRKDDSPRIAQNSSPVLQSCGFVGRDPSLGYIADLLMGENDTEEDDHADVEEIQKQLLELIDSRADLGQNQQSRSSFSSFAREQGNFSPFPYPDEKRAQEKRFIEKFWGPDRFRKQVHESEPICHDHTHEFASSDHFRSDGHTGEIWQHLPRHNSGLSTSYGDVFDRLNLSDRGLLESLIGCAKAVSNGDLNEANHLAALIRKRASPVGNVSQRLASFFVEALAVRISSLGGSIFRVLCNSFREAETLKDSKLPAENTPYLRLPHFFASQVILNACRGKKKIHVIDYGILFGIQWPALIEELANLPEGPPHFRLTGIDMPPPGFEPTGMLRQTGCRLAAYARKRGVPFKFHSISEKWEEIEPSRLGLQPDEVLIVNCLFRHHNLIDESVMAVSPRQVWLSKVRSMNPAVFIQCVKNINYAAPFFVSRFIEAMVYHAVIFDSFEHCIPRDHPDAYKFEQDKYCREILNAVACEGLERVERAENYRKSHARTERAGFDIVPVDQKVFCKAKEIAASYHRDFKLGKDGGWMLLSWKDQPVHAYSAWSTV